MVSMNLGGVVFCFSSFLLLMNDLWYFGTTSYSTELSYRLHYVPEVHNQTYDPVTLWFIRRKICVRNLEKWFLSQIIKLFVLS